MNSSALGEEFVNKIEVNYCSLCREYLTRTSKDEKVIGDHCKTKRHLKWYYQSKKKSDLQKAEASKEEGSAQDVEHVSKKHSPEKEAKAVGDTAELISLVDIKEEKVESIGDESEKFTR